MGYVKGESPGQASLFPVSLDDLIPEDHPVRVIEAFVGALDLGDLGFERAEPSAMGGLRTIRATCSSFTCTGT